MRYEVEDRIAQNYRDRFLIDKEAIYSVLKMYSKKDFIALYLEVDTDELTLKEAEELFGICVRYDSFKIAL